MGNMKLESVQMQLLKSPVKRLVTFSLIEFSQSRHHSLRVWNFLCSPLLVPS